MPTNTVNRVASPSEEVRIDIRSASDFLGAGAANSFVRLLILLVSCNLNRVPDGERENARRFRFYNIPCSMHKNYGRTKQLQSTIVFGKHETISDSDGRVVAELN